VSYSDEVRSTHRAFWRSGYPVDFIRPGGATDRYKVIVVPALYAMTAATARWLEDFAESGGRLVVTFASGLADMDQRVVGGGYPGMLRGLLGIRGEQMFPLPPGETIELSDGSQAGVWSELLRVETASVVAEYASGPLRGCPAVTRRSVGSGSATYVSTKLTQRSLDAFLAEAAVDAGIEPTLSGAADAGIEAVRRRGAEADYLFILNHSEAAVRIAGDGVDLVSGQRDRIEIDAGAVAVIREAGQGWALEA
jgi:beta-galactosidase